MISVQRPKDTDPPCEDEVWIWHIEVDTEAERDQFEVFIKAAEKYAERNEHYKDNWKRMGWRGCLVRIRERAERLWDSLWDAPEAEPDLDRLDDAIDLINFAGFLVRGVDDGNRDGSWW